MVVVMAPITVTLILLLNVMTRGLWFQSVQCSAVELTKVQVYTCIIWNRVRGIASHLRSFHNNYSTLVSCILCSYVIFITSFFDPVNISSLNYIHVAMHSLWRQFLKLRLL